MEEIIFIRDRGDKSLWGDGIAPSEGLIKEKKNTHSGERRQKDKRTRSAATPGLMRRKMT